MHNDTLARIRATYCQKHHALPGTPCFEAPAAFTPHTTFTGYCSERIATVTAVADAAREAREHDRSKRRNRAA